MILHAERGTQVKQARQCRGLYISGRTIRFVDLCFAAALTGILAHRTGQRHSKTSQNQKLELERYISNILQNASVRNIVTRL